MLGIFLIYFVGKQFYELAGKNNKNQWLFAILGVLSYYVGIFTGGALIGLLAEFTSLFSLEDLPDIVIGLMAIPVGVLTCWGTYKLLETQWGKTKPIFNNDVLDSDMIK